MAIIIGSSWWETTEWNWAKIAQEGNTTFQEVFVMASLDKINKAITLGHFLCIVPYCYIGEALATTMQQIKIAPATTVAPMSWRNHLLFDSSSSPPHLTGHPPVPWHLSCQISPLLALPQSGMPICWIPSHLQTEKLGKLFQEFTQQSLQQVGHWCWFPRGWSWGVNTALHRVQWWHMPELILGTGTSFEAMRAGTSQSPSSPN